MLNWTQYAFYLSSMVIGGFLFVIQLIVLVVLVRYLEFRQSTCYRIIFSIGINDGIQLLIFTYVGLANLFDFDLGLNTLKVLGNVMYSCVVLVYPQQMLLAVNRLFAISDARYPRLQFVVHAALGMLCIILLGLSTALFSIGTQPYYYNRDCGFWTYSERTDRMTRLSVGLENVASFGGCTLIFIVYIAIIVMLTRQRSRAGLPIATVAVMPTPATTAGARRPRQPSAERRQRNAEMRVLSICLVRFVVDACTIVLAVAYADSMLANVSWLCACCIGPITIAFMNRVVRLRFIQLIAPGQAPAPSSMTILRSTIQPSSKMRQ